MCTAYRFWLFENPTVLCRLPEAKRGISVTNLISQMHLTGKNLAYLRPE